jgi:hypothetical protein
VSELRRLGMTVGITTVVLVVLLGARPISRETILAGYAIVLAAAGMASLTRTMGAARRAEPSAFEHALARERIPPTRPNELIRVERDLVLGTESAGHFHSRLLPLLRSAASARLAAHHGIDLERQPDRSRRLLGDELWAFVRPDRPEPDDLYAPGPSRGLVRSLVDRIEAL